MEERLTVLETKISFQELTIDELNELVIEQQKQIDQLILQFKQLKEQTIDDNEGIVDISLEVPPPHY